MEDLSFWLHMDAEFMWHWYCSDKNGKLVAISTQHFFDLAEAEAALAAFRHQMALPAAA